MNAIPNLPSLFPGLGRKNMRDAKTRQHGIVVKDHKFHVGQVIRLKGLQFGVNFEGGFRTDAPAGQETTLRVKALKPDDVVMVEEVQVLG